MKGHLSWLHSELIDASLQMSLEDRADGSLLNYLRLPMADIETELYEWISIQGREFSMLELNDGSFRTFDDLSDSSRYAIVPLMLIGAIRPNADDTVLKVIMRLRNCFNVICSGHLRIVDDMVISRMWFDSATVALRTEYSAYAIYVENVLGKVNTRDVVPSKFYPIFRSEQFAKETEEED